MFAHLVTDANRKWWTLGAVAFALFMTMLDNTIVNVALPGIEADLGIDVQELEWIVTGYALSFAVLMLTGGKLADMYGRRRIFVVGLAIFTLSSLACGLSTSSGMLIAARVIQGMGAAIMMPATLSLITAAFPPQQRGAALGIWAGVSALALAIGPLIGGLITEHINWNWIFYVNVPVGILAIAAALTIIRESRDTSKEQRLDVPGLLASGVGMFTLVFALIEGSTLGWTSATILALFGVSLLAFIAFIVLEAKQRLPMFDLGLFRNSTFVGANVTALFLMVAMFGVFFFLSLFMQTILGYGPVQAGATFLPMTGLVIVVAPIAGRLSDRFGSRWLMVGGMLLVAISLTVFSLQDETANFWTLLPGTLLGGIGMAGTMSPMTSAALSAVPLDKTGVSSGMLNTFRQVGVSVGIALMGAIFASEATRAGAAGLGEVDAFLAGLHPAFRIAAIIAVCGAVIAALTVRNHAGQHRSAEPRAQAVEM